jgi:hypothetical protein
MTGAYQMRAGNWTRQGMITPSHNTGFSDLFAQMIEYRNNDPRSKHIAVRISIRQNGNIIATITPRTHALLSQLIDLFIAEAQVNWSSTLGSATFHVMKDNQTELHRLFNILVRFDDALLPVRDDLREHICSDNTDIQGAGMRRQRSFTAGEAGNIG